MPDVPVLSLLLFLGELLVSVLAVSVIAVLVAGILANAWAMVATIVDGAGDDL